MRRIASEQATARQSGAWELLSCPPQLGCADPVCADPGRPPRETKRSAGGRVGEEKRRFFSLLWPGKTLAEGRADPSTSPAESGGRRHKKTADRQVTSAQLRTFVHPEVHLRILAKTFLCYNSLTPLADDSKQGASAGTLLKCLVSIGNSDFWLHLRPF